MLISGFINKPNMCYWSDSNSHVLHESSLHSEKICCGLSAVLLPWWSRPARCCEWESLPFNDNRMFLAPIGWYGVGGHVVQQDGATSHTANVTINLLESKFGERVISRNGQVSWPHRSYDLTPLDYILWSYLKSMVYASEDWWTPYEYRTWNCSSNGRFMLENRQKLGSASGLLQARPWWSCKRNRVLFIME